jgi:hypothetical protein
LTLKVGVGVAVEALAGKSKTGTDGGWLPDGGGCPPSPPPPQPLTTNITANTIKQIAHLTIALTSVSLSSNYRNLTTVAA